MYFVGYFINKNLQMFKTNLIQITKYCKTYLCQENQIKICIKALHKYVRLCNFIFLRTNIFF